MRFKERRLTFPDYADHPKLFSTVHIRLLVALTFFVLPLAGCKTKPETGVIVLYRTTAYSTSLEMLREDIKQIPGSENINIEFRDETEGPDVKIDRSMEIEKADQFVKIPNIIGVVGHDDSRASLLAAPIYAQHKVLQIVPSATSLKLKNISPWTFMLAPDDRAEGRFMGLFAIDKLKARRVTIFFEDDEYGTGLRDGLIKVLSEHEVAIIDQVTFHTLYGMDDEVAMEQFRDIVEAAIKKGIPDIVIIAGRTREAGQIARLYNQSVPGVRFVVPDGVEVGEYFQKFAGRAADLFYIASFWDPSLPGEKSRAFVERFKRSAGRAPWPGDAMRYDAALLLVQAAIECGPDREAIRNYLNELGTTRPAYRGVTGDITFLPDRPARLIMTRVEGGNTVPVDGK
jgi:branched-chain amino acid transport system substrate-binding protein